MRFFRGETVKNGDVEPESVCASSVYISECIQQPGQGVPQGNKADSLCWSHPPSICCNVRSARVMTSERKTTSFMQEVPWLCLSGSSRPLWAASTFINLDRRAFCCIITVGVLQQRLDNGLCDSWGSQGLSSGGLQPQSCWRGWYVRITTSAESTANEILLPSFLTQLSGFMSSLELVFFAVNNDL